MSKYLVTGSSSGIGAAVAQRLRAQGHQVIGVALAGAEITADLTDLASRTAAVAEAQQRVQGGLDGLVLSAGLGPDNDPAAIVSINYFGSLAFADGLLDALRAGQQAAAVLLASTGAAQIDGEHPLVTTLLAGDEAAARVAATATGNGMLAYCASKHALACAMRARTWPWSQAGVRINAVAPGPIETPMLTALEADERISEETRCFLPPVGRKGQPDEVAEFIDYLLTPRAGFIHGSLLFIDGGIDALTRPRDF